MFFVVVLFMFFVHEVVLGLRVQGLVRAEKTKRGSHEECWWSVVLCADEGVGCRLKLGGGTTRGGGRGGGGGWDYSLSPHPAALHATGEGLGLLAGRNGTTEKKTWMP